ncbi:MAG: carboxypeptidase regulatory-like domain-containing protein, partial [Blastocatellia bacterium]
WLYNGKNKTFFFGSFEMFRNRAGAGEFVTSVPTPEMYQGDFSRWVDNTGRVLPIYDPNTTRANPNYNPALQITESNPRFIRDVFPNNRIPANRFSPLASRYLQYVGNTVHPNAAGAAGTLNYVNNNFRSFAGSSLFPWTKWSVKLDHNFSERHKISGLYNYGLSEVLPGVDGFPQLPASVTNFRQTNQDSHLYRANYTWTISPNLINYAYGGINWWKQLNTTPNAIGGWKDKGICLPGAFDCDFNILQVNFSDYAGWGGSAGDGSENPVFTVGDDLTYIRGRHTIKGGYLFERLHYNGFGRQSLSGRVDFNRRSTSIPESNSLPLGGGNSFASFLLGEVYNAGTENNRFVRQYWRGHAAYIQDDWKVSNRLTLNFGMRYDVSLPPLERDDKWSDFDPYVPNPGANGRPGALRFAGTNAGEVGKRTLTEGWYNGWGPRFSFAYSPDEKTVFRGGVGRTFGLVRTTSGSTHFAGAIQIWNVNNLDGINRLWRLDDGFIANGVNTVPQPPSVDPAFNVNGDVDWWQGQEVSRLPENWNWTMSIQRQLGNNMVVEASYNASVGVHLMSGLLNFNQLPSQYLLDPRVQPLLSSRIDSAAVIAAGFTKPYASFPNNLSLDRALRPFPQYQNVNTWSGNGDRSGHSTYHAMVLKMERRISDGLTMQGSYVWSKLITDSDTVDAGGRALDHYNRRWEKSVGAFDLPHNVKFSYIYDTPIGKGKRFDLGGAGNFLIGGWRLAGIHVYTSGQPLPLSGGAATLGGRNAALVKTLDGWLAAFPENEDWRGTTRYYVSACQIAAVCNNNVVVPQTNRLGNAPRFNSRARRMANLNENISLQKTFNFTEKLRMDFRWELFNVFNRVVFDPPDSSITSQTFGRITGQNNSPRQMQFGLKLIF